MSNKNRSIRVVSFVPALLLVGVCAVVQAATPTTKVMRWSDPATWPDHKVPAAGDKVEIARGQDVVLDVSPPALHGLTINGKLSFSDQADLALTTEWVMVHGELQIGTEAKPYSTRPPSR